MSITGIGSTSAYATVATGLQQSQARVNQDAQTVASQGPDVNALVDLNTNSQTFQALTKVEKALNQTSKRLLDITV